MAKKRQVDDREVLKFKFQALLDYIWGFAIYLATASK